MANPPITRFTSLATAPSPSNPNNGLYVPPLNSTQIAAIPAETKLNGGIWYNNTLNQLEAQVNGNTIPLAAGNGNVSGPANSTNNNIAVFDGTTGKVIKDSGVGINQVPGPPPLLRSSIDTLSPNAFVNEISNIGHIKFINDVSSIYVDTLTSIRFFPYDDQICSVFTSEIGAGGSSTSQSALLEINSDSGVLLLSRLTDQEQTALAAPLVAGMMFYNKTSNVFKCRDNSGWRTMPLYNTNGTLDVATPISSTNATTKAYVDSAISGSGFAPGLATYIVQTATNKPTNAQVLGSLTTGLLMNTTTTGVLSIGIPGTDYYSPNNPTRLIETGLNNLFIGKTAGNTSLSGTNNTGVGIQVLSSLTTGITNSGFGYESLRDNIAGNDNCSFGYQALRLNNGSLNSSFGSQALRSNTTGASNCAFGYQSLIGNFVGNFNCAFGMASLGSNTANNNSAFGYSSLFNNTTGADNCAFGFQSLLLNDTGSFNTAFGSQALSTNIASNNSAFGYTSLYNNTTGVNNCGFGFKTLYLNISGQNNSAFGYESLLNNSTGDQNCAFGSISLANNTTGSGNTGFGVQSVGSNTTGSGNTGFGTQSLQRNITGSNNAAFGQGAASLRAIYNSCLFLGQGADASANNLTNAVAIGYQASVGADNSMVLGGSGANQLSVGIGLTPNAQLQLPTVHANRKLVLYQTANNDHQVHGLGTAAGIFRFQLDSNSSSSAYTFNAGLTTTTSAELMRLTGDGYLGIGTVSPHAPLQFANTSLNRKIVLYDDNNNDHQFYGFGVGSSIFRFQVDSVGAAHVFYAGISTVTSNELMRIQGNGRVGIGTSSPDQMLTVNSSTPSKITAGSWAAFSDARIKDIVGDYEHGLAEIIQIKTRKFKYNDRSGYPDSEKAKTNIGVIAQEIEDVFPECIVERVERGDISDMRVYDGTALTYALINAVKELNNEIINLKQQINN